MRVHIFTLLRLLVGTLTFSKETIERFEKLFSTVNSKFDLPEHDLLRQHHVRDESGFLLAHRATRHRHDRQFIYEPAVARLEVPQPVQGDLLSPLVEK